jgi:hypothetical protein
MGIDPKDFLEYDNAWKSTRTFRDGKISPDVRAVGSVARRPAGGNGDLLRYYLQLGHRS